jgi:hypothetical protein
VCALLIYFSNNRIENPNGKTLEEFFWFFLSSVYGFLSLDEAASVHEIIDQALHVKWVYVYAPFTAIFFMICSYYIMIIRNSESTLRNRILETMLEEGFEMIGAITAIFAK